MMRTVQTTKQCETILSSLPTNGGLDPSSITDTLANGKTNTKKRKVKRFKLKLSPRSKPKKQGVSVSPESNGQNIKNSGIKRKRLSEEVDEGHQKDISSADRSDTQITLSLPSLTTNYDDGIEPPSKKTRHSKRIKACGKRKKIIDGEIEEYVNYNFEFEKVISFDEFMESTIWNRYHIETMNDCKEIHKLFDLLLVGLHVDFEDAHHGWYESIIAKVKISIKKQIESSHSSNIRIFDRLNISLLIHTKNFSSFWDRWITLPTERIAVLRSYSNAYDAGDHIKPLGEVIRELDEMQAVSIDFIAERLRLNRTSFIKWINAENVEWDDWPDQDEDMERIERWIKTFLYRNEALIRSEMLNKKNLVISKEYFVKAKSKNDEGYVDVNVFEAILPKSLNVRLQTLMGMELLFIRNVVIDNLSSKKADYVTMSNECGIPLGLFQEIVFGITKMMPHFIIDRIVNWSKGNHVINDELTIKEKQMFHVKID